jgi:DNA-binding NtrC family response regulator
MPGLVVVVHSNEGFAQEAARALRHAGYQVAAFSDPMQALDALDSSETVDLLITRVNYPSGRPNGVALALMARNRRPQIRVVFTARADMRRHAEGIGEFLAVPVAVADLVAVVARLLPQAAAPVEEVPVATIRDPVLERPASGAVEGLRAFTWAKRRLVQLAAKTIVRSRQLHDRSAELQLAVAHSSELVRVTKPE